MTTPEIPPLYIGIDIANETFDACLNGQVRQWKNTSAGIAAFIKSLPSYAYCVMEATGTYGSRLAEALLAAAIPVSVVNPLVIKRFGQMKQRRAKTDHADAKLITLYAQQQAEDLRPFVAMSEEENAMAQEQAVRHQLMEQQTAIKNQIHALKQRPRPSKAALAALETLLKTTKQAIKDLDKEIELHAKRAAAETYDVLLSIPGIGPVAAAALITATRSFERFDRAPQFAAFIGICPNIVESGSSVRPRAAMSKMGSARLRSVLYMAASVAMRCNDACIALAKRLKERGKTHKQICVAVINKLLKQVFALVKSGQHFVKGYKPATPANAQKKILAY